MLEADSMNEQCECEFQAALTIHAASPTCGSPENEAAAIYPTHRIADSTL